MLGANLSNLSMAADCVPESIDIESQAEVLAFQTDHGQGGVCDTVLGYLRISGDDIVDLAPLADLKHVGVECDRHHILCPSLTIEGNTSLTDLDGLTLNGSLPGDLTIRENPALTNVDGLSEITSVGGALAVYQNGSLGNLDGFSAITSVGSNALESLTIYENLSLDNIDGLANLMHADWLYFSGNNSLTNLDGLASLTDLTWGIDIANHAALENVDGLSGVAGNKELSIRLDYLPALQSLEGLSGLSEVNSLHIGNTKHLASLKGLENVISLGSISLFWNEALSDVSALASLSGEIGSIGIGRNPSLHDLNGLSGVTGLTNGLFLTHNGLTDLQALQSLQFVGGSLIVEENEHLEDCGVLAFLIDNIDDWEPGPGPGAGGAPDVGYDVVLSNNGQGCNSINEVLGSAPLAEINPGLNDAWYNPETDGQGFFLTVYGDLQKVFLSWYTFELERPPGSVTADLGEPGHRWLTAQGPFVDNQAILDMWVTKGGVFDSPVPEVERAPDGEIILEFQSCNEGTVTYDIPSVDRQGVIPIERIALDNVPQCYLLERMAEAGASSPGG